MSDPNKLRSAALWSWFVALCQSHDLGKPEGEIQPVSGDASFRRYFRGTTAKGSWILVDAPVAREDSRPFLSVQKTLAAAGVQVPQVLAADTREGFMCLQDFGSELLLSKLKALPLVTPRENRNTATAGALYRLAFDELLKIQRCDPRDPVLPVFDRAMLLREMQLFTDWLCKGLLQLELSDEESRLLDVVQEHLIASALDQPQVYVHRDYHSRNLMLMDSGLGVIDFQDAVLGPFTYDLVSLLKDCYVGWPAVQVRNWALEYLQLAEAMGIVTNMNAARFLNSFDLMGMQRHLKAAGIFCRLWLRDGKPGYLSDIPLTLSYICRIRFEDSDLQAFADWIGTRILPLILLELQQFDRKVLATEPTARLPS